jgi:hypothetical protein
MKPLTETVPDILNRSARKDKHNVQTTAVLVGEMAKHSVIIRKGTTFLIVFSILSLYAAMYLIHMESVDRHDRNAAYKAAVR